MGPLTLMISLIRLCLAYMGILSQSLLSCFAGSTCFLRLKYAFVWLHSTVCRMQLVHSFLNDYFLYPFSLILHYTFLLVFANYKQKVYKKKHEQSLLFNYVRYPNSWLHFVNPITLFLFCFCLFEFCFDVCYQTIRCCLVIKGNHITSIIIWPYIHKAQCIVIQLQEKRPLREKRKKKSKTSKKFQ